MARLGRGLFATGTRQHVGRKEAPRYHPTSVPSGRQGESAMKEGRSELPLRHVHLVVRAGLPPTAGNMITAQRLAAGLIAAGIGAAILPADALDRRTPPAPDTVVHALHALGAGVAAVRWAGRAPVVWTFTGTELADVEEAELAAMRQAARAVSAHIAFHADGAAIIQQRLAVPPQTVRVIPPGVAANAGPPPSADAPDAPLLLLPAGIRAVKNPELALKVLEAVLGSSTPARLIVLGPARDPVFHHAFQQRLAQVPEARYLGEVGHPEMAEWYARATLVLNTSLVEGLSNAVLEAMAAGRCVLATDIPGNRAAIRHGIDGWLAPPADLPGAAVRLLRDHGLRARLGAAAQASVRARFSPEAEIDTLVRLYRDVGLPAGA